MKSMSIDIEYRSKKEKNKFNEVQVYLFYE